jgi:hypothetical protein
MAKSEQTASTMWNGAYNEDEKKRRRNYDRTPGSDYSSNLDKQKEQGHGET